MRNHQKEGLYAALDVGTTKVCTIVARVAASGEVEVLAWGLSPSQGVKKGMVVSLEETQAAVRRAVEAAQEDLGRKLPPVLVGITGSHLSCQSAIASATSQDHTDRAFSPEDVTRLLQSTVPQAAPQQEVLHVIPRVYTLDGIPGVRNPLGLHGQRLEVESRVVMAEASPLENIITAVRSAGVGISGLVLEPLASSEAVLTADEREMGVLLVDIGGGTSDMAVFQDGTLWHTAVLPVGGYQLTNDLALALGIPFPTAESMKLQHGHAVPEAIDPAERVEFPEPEKDGTRQVSRQEVCRLLHERVAELVRLVLYKVHQAGLERVPAAGVVLTGGSAKLPGLVSLVREMTEAPVRIGSPRASLGLPPDLQDPCYATSVGILLWSIRNRDDLLVGNRYRWRAPPWYRQLAGWASRLLSRKQI